MNCIAINAILDLFTDDLLTPARRGAVERHLKECKHCANVASSVRVPKGSSVKAPESLKERLRQAASRAAATAAPLPSLPQAQDGRSFIFSFAVCAFLLLALHALTPKSLSEHPVASSSAPWRLP